MSACSTYLCLIPMTVLEISMLATCNIINVIRLKEGKIIAFLLSESSRTEGYFKNRKVSVNSAKMCRCGCTGGIDSVYFTSRLIRPSCYNVMRIVRVQLMLYALCWRNDCFGLLTKPFIVQCSVACAGYIPPPDLSTLVHFCL